jgi:Acetoacetate decarboxylase (ADC)
VAERIAENTWKIQDTTLRMPVVIRDAALAAAVFTCDAAAARRAIAGTGLDPLLFAGRGLAALICVRYRDGDLGPYDEVGLIVAVRSPGGHIGIHTLELPVTQEFTLEAGRAIWALPKWLARCDLTIGRRRSAVHLAERDTFVLAGVLDTGPVPLPVPVRSAVTAFSRCHGDPPATVRDHLLFGKTSMRLTGLRVRPGGTRLVLGDHRMAETARALGMEGRPLCTMTVPKLTMELGEWTPLHPTG